MYFSTTPILIELFLVARYDDFNYEAKRSTNAVQTFSCDQIPVCENMLTSNIGAAI